MESVMSLLNEAQRRGFELTVASDRTLEIEGPEDCEDIANKLIDHKGEVMHHLEPVPDEDEEEKLLSANGTQIMTIGQLVANNPTLHEPVIDGILRRGETMNLIADPKRGKSWMLYAQLLSVATGLPWLGRFQCAPGRVLLIDNELHKPTLANRIPKVASAMGIREVDYCHNLDILPLRGQLMDLIGINRLLATISRGEYSLIAFDAFYRGIPAGVSENDNAQIANLYNLIDQTTNHINCAWLNIHHASKGSQSGKSITDVGAGAGSQSRAADAHLILREHQEDSTFVLDGVVRSFAPITPVALRWEWPLWRVDLTVDPSKLAGLLTTSEQRQNAKDVEGIEAITKALSNEPATATGLRAVTGLSRDRCAKLIAVLERDDKLTSVDTINRGNPCKLYSLKTTQLGTSRWLPTT